MGLEMPDSINWLVTSSPNTYMIVSIVLLKLLLLQKNSQPFLSERTRRQLLGINHIEKNKLGPLVNLGHEVLDTESLKSAGAQNFNLDTTILDVSPSQPK